jgi:hypothetical protein
MSDGFCQACTRLAIYRKVRKNSLSAQFSVGRYIVLIISKPSPPPSRPHHQAVPTTKPSPPPSRPHQAVPTKPSLPSRPHHQAVLSTKQCSPPSSAHHQAVLTTKQCSPPSSAHHQAVLTTKQCSPPSSAHHQAVLTTKPYYQATVASQPTKPPTMHDMGQGPRVLPRPHQILSFTLNRLIIICNQKFCIFEASHLFKFWFHSWWSCLTSSTHYLSLRASLMGVEYAVEMFW